MTLSTDVILSGAKDPCSCICNAGSSASLKMTTHIYLANLWDTTLGISFQHASVLPVLPVLPVVKILVSSK